MKGVKPCCDLTLSERRLNAFLQQAGRFASLLDLVGAQTRSGQVGDTRPCVRLEPLSLW